MRGSIRRVAFVGNVDPAVAEALREHGFRVEPVAGDSVVSVARDLMRLRPAVVHARESHLKVGLVARLLNLPFVVQAGSKEVNALTARAARMADRTLCGGAAVREELVALGAPQSSTVVVRGLLESRDLAGSTVFEPMAGSQTRWVVSASPCDGPDRGQADLVLAFLAVARTRPSLNLLLAGGGIEARTLLAQIEHAGLRGRAIVRHLTLDHLPGLFARAAAVVAASRSGGLPDPVPEALAMGAPVIATAVGQHTTWVREGRTGWLVPARAPVALAARLGQVLDDVSLARRVGQTAMREACELQQPGIVALALARCWSGIARLSPTPYAGFYLSEPTHRAIRV
jgi:glycosyltransferase involved in cell wall biosynthesis